MRYSLFGESHGSAIGVVLEGVPSGLFVDMDFITAEMARRAPGTTPSSTTRREPDTVQIISGVFEGKTTGTPLCALIENTNTHSKDYEATRWLARPGHADYTGHIRYAGYNDYRGGGHFSGRLTAPLVFAGAIAKLTLSHQQIAIYAHIKEIAGIEDAPVNMTHPYIQALQEVADKAFPVLDDLQGKAMLESILQAKNQGDSVGGIIECIACGLPSGWGGPDYTEHIEGIIAKHVFTVPAVKGIEFGTGFGLATMRGSEANDSLYADPLGHIKTRTNHNGGLNGGISNGMPLIFRAVIKPTPSIAAPQETINMQTGTPESLRITGRHDPCILPRAVPVIEAVTALALCQVSSAAMARL